MSYYDEDALEEMKGQVQEFGDEVVGHKIVSAEKTAMKNYWGGAYETFVITLDNGKQVVLDDTSDCCAYGELNSFLLNVDAVDHVITSVKANDDCTEWFVFADMEQVLKLDVAWSEGNYPYYGFGLRMDVVDAPAQEAGEEVEAA